MKSINYIYLALSCITQIGFSQTDKQLHGKVLSDDFPLQGVKIINLNTEKSSITNNNGDFIISAKPNDMLVFYELEYNYKRKQLTDKEIYDDYIIVRMDKKPIELKEVVIEKPKIDAVSLGIVSANQKTYTPAERKLKSATELKATGSHTGFAGGSISLDPLINRIIGRTKKLKKELSVEKCELRLAKLDKLYDNEFYTEKLKIQLDYIKAFQYYVIYDTVFIASMDAKNKNSMTFRITELAVEFNQLLNEKPNKS